MPAGYWSHYGIAPAAAVQRKELGSVSVSRSTPGSGAAESVAHESLQGPSRQVPYLGEMNQAFGADFGGVRAFDGPASQAACQQLGAEAFALGDAVAFSSAAPSREVVAHELAHVVQQGHGGARLQLKSGGAAGALEAEADAAAREATTLGQVSTPLSAVSPRLSLLRRLGQIAFQDSFAHTSGTVSIRARTTAEWQTFLREDADETDGSIELNAFMALALGRRGALSGICMEQTITADPPTQEEAVNLMTAFLTVGTDIDLPESLGEGHSQATTMMASLMSDFINRYTAPAIQRRSRTGEMSRGEVESVTAFAEDAEDMQDEGSLNHPPNPVHTLMASCLGTACAAAVVAIKAYQSRATDPEADGRQREAYRQMRNSSLTIRGCLDHLQAGPDPGLVTIFAGAVSALAAAVPVTWGVAAAVTAWGLSGAASAYFPNLLAGEGKERARDLLDQFKDRVNQAGEAENVQADVIENIKNAFEAGFNY